LLTPVPDGGSDVGIPVLMVKRAALEAPLAALAAGRPVKASLEAGLIVQRSDAFNVVGRIPASRTPRRGTVVVGAHYDHLGLGGHGSLAPDKHEPHPGADDNASGTAAVLELARALAARRAELSRDVLVILFSGEEAGLLGSTQFTRMRPEVLADTLAMLNLDMVGRLRGNRVEVLGSETASEWLPLIAAACDGESIRCAPSSDGFGASDQAAFYGAGLPVLHFFTGTHADYHKPSDTAGKINASGAAAVARLVERVVVALEHQPRLSYLKGATPPARGDARSFNASLGSIPDYSGPPGGAPGVLLAGVRPGGAAEQAGLRRGDVLVRLGKHEIRSVQDLGFALGSAHPGETLTAEVIREGKALKLETTLQEAKGPR
jgi:Iap family predicted aminopeptidase